MNSGRLSVPATLRDSALNSADDAEFAGAMMPGAAAADAPVQADGQAEWLLRQMHAGHFTALLFGGSELAPVVRELRAAASGIAPLQVLIVVPAGSHASVEGSRTLVDVHRLLTQRYDGRSGTLYLLRPDQHVCARWRSANAGLLRNALRCALALAPLD